MSNLPFVGENENTNKKESHSNDVIFFTDPVNNNTKLHSLSNNLIFDNRYISH